MLINCVPGEECRIAITRGGKLEEYYQERVGTLSHVGNIYRGRVVNVEPSIQAAFVDFGLERNGFLHISDLHPMYFPGKDREAFEKVGSKTPHRERPPMQRCLRRGQEILVQVLKEGIGTKGPTLTSYLSIPGRFVVMMPHMQRLGVSRKVEDDDARREMRKLLADLKPPEGFGFIVRTAGLGQTKTELKRDLAYLQRLWRSIERRLKRGKGPAELYTESDLVIRTIRDVYSNEIERIIVDDAQAAKRAHDFLAIASPRSRSRVVYYKGRVPLFNLFDIERQIDHINAHEVPLSSGGSLVFDQAEALVAIDVNSGKSRDARDAETNAYRTNLEAVDEICRQLRLRDLGGVVICDLIDMRSAKHRREVEARFRQNLKHDRARTRITSISQFGILEMTRQRMRPSLKKSLYNTCTHCDGTGHVKNPEGVVLDVMRRLAVAMHHDGVARIELIISPDVAFQLLNRKRSDLVSLEGRFGKPVMVRVGGSRVDFVSITAFDERGGTVEVIEPRRPREDAIKGSDDFVEVGSDTSVGELDEAELDEAEPTEPWAADEADEAPEADEDRPAATEALDDESAERRAESDNQGGSEEGEGRGRRRRRRRRRGKRGGGSGETQASGGADADAQASGDARGEPEARDKDQPADAKESAGADQDTSDRAEAQASGDKPRRRRRSRRRRKSGDGDSAAAQDGAAATETASGDAADSGEDEQRPRATKDQPDGDGDEQGGESNGKRRRRRRGRRGGGRASSSNGKSADDAPAGDAKPQPADDAKPVGSGYTNRLLQTASDAQDQP